MGNTLLQSIIRFREKCSVMVATKTSGLVAVSSTNVSTFWRRLFYKVLLRYTPDQVKFWATDWSDSEPFRRLCTWCFIPSKGNIDWCRRISHFFYLLCGSGREKTYHIPFLIICSRHWSLYDLMGISGFPSLGIPLNLEEPAYLEHVSSSCSSTWGSVNGMNHYV